MKELSLRDRLLKYMVGRPGQYISSGELQRLTVQHTKHTPRSAVRRLQELHEDGKIEHTLIKNHSYYRAPNKTQYPSAEALEINKAAIKFFDNYDKAKTF